MRGHLILIREAELLSSSPERVYSWLEARSTRQPRESDDGDEAMEQALLDRHDPLIDIALARFCQCDSTAHALFTQANTVNSQHSHERAVRLAVLSNTALGGLLSLNGIPVCLFGSDSDGFNTWLASSSDEELVALFSNPIVSELFLRDFLEGKSAWQSLDDGHRITALRALSGNPRMKAEYSGDMDGYGEYTYNSVFHASWNLAKTLPVTREWAMVLGQLLSVIPHESHELGDPLHVAQRWRPDAHDQRGLKDEAEIAINGYVWSYGLVRQSLAMLKDAHDDKARDALLNSDDFAFRASAYCRLKLTVDQIQSAYERDKNLAVNSCQQNYALWKYPDLRKALHDISWEACAFNSNYMDSANAFNRKAEQVKAIYPEWFKDEDEKTNITPATKADISSIAETLKSQNELISEHANLTMEADKRVMTALARLGWIWWFSLGALVASLWHKF